MNGVFWPTKGFENVYMDEMFIRKVIVSDGERYSRKKFLGNAENMLLKEMSEPRFKEVSHLFLETIDDSESSSSSI